MELYQGIAQFNAGIGGTDQYTHIWYVHRMDAGPDDQELIAKIRETCLKRWVVLSAIPAGATSAKVKKKRKQKKREEGTTSATACEKKQLPILCHMTCSRAPLVCEKNYVLS